MIVCLLGVSTNSVQQKRIVLRSSLRQYPLKSEAFTKPNKIETIGNLHLRRNIALVRPTRGRKYHSPQGTSCDSKGTHSDGEASRTAHVVHGSGLLWRHPAHLSIWVGAPDSKDLFGVRSFRALVCLCFYCTERMSYLQRAAFCVLIFCPITRWQFGEDDIPFLASLLKVKKSPFKIICT